MGWRKQRQGMDDSADAAATLVATGETNGIGSPQAHCEAALFDAPDTFASVDASDGDAQGTGAHLGQFVSIIGELRGDEDVDVEGRVEGVISLRGRRLMVGSTGQVHAQIHARAVLVDGLVVGDITATERVEITATGNVQGEIRAPRVVLADGARFRGKIDMGPVPCEVDAGTEDELPACLLDDGDGTITLFDEAVPADTRV